MPSRARYIADFQVSANDIVDGAITPSDLGTIYTSNVTEGTNLYFSNARVRDAITTGNNISYNSTTGNITLSPSGVTPTTYGNATIVPVLTIDTFGRVTAASNVTISGGGTVAWQSVQTTGFTAVSNRAYSCNTTSAAFTVTLPASPTAGDLITLTDYAGTWDTNNLTVNPNGGKINGATANATLSTERGSINLVYVDTTQGWISYASNLSTSIVQTTPTVEYLVVAGGGGGGRDNYGSQRGAGGGGAGGYRSSVAGESSGGGGSAESAITVSPGTTYTVTIGAGGTGGLASPDTTVGVSGTDGSNSVFGSITSVGGGGGGGHGTNFSSSGRSGGSGGGPTNDANAGSGTANQGYDGGAGSSSATAFNGGGGGGAGSVGGSGTASAVGNGGSGVSSAITGSSLGRAGGGGGSGSNGNGTASSGGGAGNNSGNATDGSPNTGGGGGAARQAVPGNGGSGVVIIRYADTYAAAVSTTGSPTVTTSGGYRIYKWTGNGSITF